MVSLRFISYLLVLTYMMYHVRYCTAKKYYEASNIILGPSGSPYKVVGERSSHISEKEIYDGVPSVAEVSNKRHGGRKMMEVQFVYGDQEAQISGEEHFVGSCIQGDGGILNVKCNIVKSTTRPRRLKAKMADFIAFNADYHVPRPHPPKNN